MARAEKMYGVPRTGPWWPAVGAPLERGVRPRIWERHETTHFLAAPLPGLDGPEDWAEEEYGLASDGTGVCGFSAVAFASASDLLSALYPYHV